MDAKTARTLNIRRWVAEAGGPADFADKYGGGRWVAAQVSQWISETAPKGIGHNLARDIEAKLGKAPGAMDQAPGDPLLERASQPARIDPATLAESIAALRQVAKNKGWVYDPETHPEVTVYAYELCAALPAVPLTADVIDFGARLADRLQQQQARGKDGQGEGRPAGEVDRKRAQGRATAK